jgi:predicted DNA-binding transcriptional regulator YafY
MSFRENRARPIKPPEEQARRRRVLIEYTNYRGERSTRTIEPHAMEFGANQWHPEPQWLLYALDVDKREARAFAMSGIHSWSKAP